jgi:hypothetical protein
MKWGSSTRRQCSGSSNSRNWRSATMIPQPKVNQITRKNWGGLQWIMREKAVQKAVSWRSRCRFFRRTCSNTSRCCRSWNRHIWRGRRISRSLDAWMRSSACALRRRACLNYRSRAWRWRFYMLGTFPQSRYRRSDTKWTSKVSKNQRNCKESMNSS